MAQRAKKKQNKTVVALIAVVIVLAVAVGVMAGILILGDLNKPADPALGPTAPTVPTTTAAPTTTTTTTVTTTGTTTTTTFVDDGSGSALIESVFGKETADRLLALDNTKRGWGQGVQFDKKNRPQACLTYQNKFGKYDAYYIMPEENKIYLTIDEGYENGYTASMLDTLKEKDAKAVFFVTLSYVKQNPKLVQRMIDEGHIVGNHSAAHPSYPTLTLDKAYADAKKLHDYMVEKFDYEMTLFRFPSGENSEQMLALMQEMGYTTLFWSYAYADWDPNAQPDPAKTLKNLVDRLHPGALYLLHAVSATNAEILGDAIDAWRAAGYEVAKWEHPTQE